MQSEVGLDTGGEIVKCLTICQPYPYLILTPQAELPSGVEQKRVENRTWSTKVRGPLLIHVGKSRKWLETFPSINADLTFSAIVGVVDIVDVVQIVCEHGHCQHWPQEVCDRYPWIIDHQHAEGPFCWILSNPRRFKRPIPYTGRLGLFEVPDSVVEDAMRRVKWS